MRDSYKKKRRDLRKATLKCWSFTAYDLYELIHPEPACSCKDSEWRCWYNSRDEWVRKHYGVCYRWFHSSGEIPADFRRGLNSLRRAREKAALRKAGQDEDLDVIIPASRRNLRWEYW